MKKRDSLRRWKARCAAGRIIPAQVIVEHELGRWFHFVYADFNADYWIVSK
jgi:hypothetical protein